MDYGIIWQPRIWVRNKESEVRWRLIKEGNFCASEGRAVELLEELKQTLWWAEVFDENPMKNPKNAVHFGVVDRKLEWL